MPMDRRHSLILGLVVIAVIAASSYIYAQKMSPPPRPVPSETVDAEHKADKTARGAARTGQDGKVVVYVSGAVLRPGVVSLDAGARAIDAVQAAGGLAADADAEKVNLAQPLRDGMQVNVPHVSAGNSAAVGGPGVVNKAGGGGKVNINTASLAELDSLPGIGPALAQRIIDYRANHGPFTTLEDLKKVTGIGDSKFERLKDRISL